MVFVLTYRLQHFRTLNVSSHQMIWKWAMHPVFRSSTPSPSDLYQVLILVLSSLLLFLIFSLSFFYFSYCHIGEKSLRPGKWCLGSTKSKGSKQLTPFKKQSLCFTRIFWVISGEHLFWKYVEKITLIFKSLSSKVILFVVPTHCIITQWKAPGTRILRGRSNSLNQRWEK